MHRMISMRTLTLILALLAMASMPTFAQAENKPIVDYHYVDRPFLELLGFLEGPDGYNDITGFTDIEPVKPVIWMTIDEVLDFQRLLRQKGEESSAMGRYQFIYKTLLYLTDYHNIDRSGLFDKRMQDHLARLEMKRCGFYDRHESIPNVGNCLASVWAALPLLTGNKKGQSKYKKTGINFAQTSPAVFAAVLRARVIEYRPQTWTPKKSTKPKKSVPRQVQKSGFSDSADVYKGYGAPLKAISPEALAIPVITEAPKTSLRPKSRSILVLKNGREVSGN
jgi:hypothetical protein